MEYARRRLPQRSTRVIWPWDSISLVTASNSEAMASSGIMASTTRMVSYLFMLFLRTSVGLIPAGLAVHEVNGRKPTGPDGPGGLNRRMPGRTGNLFNGEARANPCIHVKTEEIKGLRGRDGGERGAGRRRDPHSLPALGPGRPPGGRPSGARVSPARSSVPGWIRAT